MMRAAFLSLLLIFLPVFAMAAGPVLYRDGGIIRAPTELDANGVIYLKGGSAYLSSSGQDLTVQAASGYDTDLIAVSGQQVAIKWPSGTGFYLDDSNGYVVLRTKDAVTSQGRMESSTGGARMLWTDSQSYMAFSGGQAGIGLYDSSGWVVLRPWASHPGGTGGVAIQNMAGTVNMLSADSSGSGDMSLRAAATADYLYLNDGTNTNRIKIGDTATETWEIQVNGDTYVTGNLTATATITGATVSDGTAYLNSGSISECSALRAPQDTGLNLVAPDADENSSADVIYFKVDNYTTQWKITSTALLPNTDNAEEIGASGTEVKKIWAQNWGDGDGTVQVDGNMVVTGSITASAVAPVGSITSYAGSSIPSGWLDCDGSAVSRTTYSALFAAIGTTWGVGDGSTTFNLPDLRGRSPLGVGTGAGLTARALADSGGEEDHQLSIAELPSHRHTVSTYVGNYLYASTISDTLGVTGPFTRYSGYTGSDTGHNTMHPFRGVYFIIKT